MIIRAQTALGHLGVTRTYADMKLAMEKLDTNAPFAVRPLPGEMLRAGMRKRALIGTAPRLFRRISEAGSLKLATGVLRENCHATRRARVDGVLPVDYPVPIHRLAKVSVACNLHQPKRVPSPCRSY